MLIRQAQIYGATQLSPMDIRCNEQIEDIASRLQAQPNEPTINANGGIVMPGLHDHHIHFRALTAARTSLDCRPATVTNAVRLAAALRQQPQGRWIRGIGYHNSIAGPLNRHWLDEQGPAVPIRIQHQSGKCWILNSLALELLHIDPNTTDERFERDNSGLFTGRLFRLDDWLRARLNASGNSAYQRQEVETQSIKATSDALLAVGITSFTDTSATNNLTSVDWFRDQHQAGHIHQQCYPMGDTSLASGHLKILLDEDALPDVDVLVTQVRQAHAQARPVAFHCVTSTELVVAMHTLEVAGPHTQDRIEHASVVTEEHLDLLKSLNLCIVTQPGFIADRGDRYLQEVSASQLHNLYRYRSLLDAGIRVVCSSDAPYGPYSPWQVIAAAEQRRTPNGSTLTANERVAASTALRGYLTSAQAPAGPMRQVVTGAEGNLVLLDQNWQEFIANPAATSVRCVLLNGQLAYDSEAGTLS